MPAIRPLLFAVLLNAGAMAAAAAAPTQGPADPNPSAVRAGAYALEPVHTRVLFSVSHLGFTTWYGDFTHASGSLVLDPRHPSASRVEVSIAAASIATTNAALDAELKGPDWFDAAASPTILYRSSKLTVSGPGRAIIEGDLTLHGVTRKLSLLAKFNGAGIDPFAKTYTVGFEAVGKLKRSDFGIAKDVPLIGDEVSIFISAAFVPRPD
jgi:polyisoprenoid-binding protein YceI